MGHGNQAVWVVDGTGLCANVLWMQAVSNPQRQPIGRDCPGSVFCTHSCSSWTLTRATRRGGTITYDNLMVLVSFSGVGLALIQPVLGRLLGRCGGQDDMEGIAKYSGSGDMEEVLRATFAATDEPNQGDDDVEMGRSVPEAKPKEAEEQSELPSQPNEGAWASPRLQAGPGQHGYHGGELRGHHGGSAAQGPEQDLSRQGRRQKPAFSPGQHMGVSSQRPLHP